MAQYANYLSSFDTQTSTNINQWTISPPAAAQYYTIESFVGYGTTIGAVYISTNPTGSFMLAQLQSVLVNTLGTNFEYKTFSRQNQRYQTCTALVPFQVYAVSGLSPYTMTSACISVAFYSTLPNSINMNIQQYHGQTVSSSVPISVTMDSRISKVDLTNIDTTTNLNVNVTNSSLNTNITNTSLSTTVTNTGFDSNITNTLLNVNLAQVNGTGLTSANVPIGVQVGQLGTPVQVDIAFINGNPISTTNCLPIDVEQVQGVQITKQNGLPVQQIAQGTQSIWANDNIVIPNDVEGSFFGDRATQIKILYPGYVTGLRGYNTSNFSIVTQCTIYLWDNLGNQLSALAINPGFTQEGMFTIPLTPAIAIQPGIYYVSYNIQFNDGGGYYSTFDANLGQQQSYPLNFLVTGQYYSDLSGNFPNQPVIFNEVNFADIVFVGPSIFNTNINGPADSFGNIKMDIEDVRGQPAIGSNALPVQGMTLPIQSLYGPDGTTPDGSSESFGYPGELGFQFTANNDGIVTAARFNVTAHNGLLTRVKVSIWDNIGTLLNYVIFTGPFSVSPETMQTVPFPTSLKLTSGNQYVLSYSLQFSDDGGYYEYITTFPQSPSSFTVIQFVFNDTPETFPDQPIGPGESELVDMVFQVTSPAISVNIVATAGITLPTVNIPIDLVQVAHQDHDMSHPVLVGPSDVPIDVNISTIGTMEQPIPCDFGVPVNLNTWGTLIDNTPQKVSNSTPIPTTGGGGGIGYDVNVSSIGGVQIPLLNNLQPGSLPIFDNSVVHKNNQK